MKLSIKATPVFQKNWDALLPRNPDGTRVNKILINEGSSRSSKTWSFFLLIFLYCLQNARRRVFVLRTTAVGCRENVETEFIDWLNDPMGRVQQFEEGEITQAELTKFLKKEELTKHITENKSKHRHTFNKSKSSITFTGADNVNKIIGKGNDVIWVNEPYDFPEEVLNQLIQRAQDFVLLDWNPKQAHYIDKKYKKRDNAIVIHSTYKDNPFCPPETKKHIESYLPLDNKYIETSLENVAQYKAMKTGKFIELLDSKGIEGPEREELLRAHNNERQKTASEFDHCVYALGIKSERKNRIFNWTPISLHEYEEIKIRPVYYHDWGVLHPWAIGEVKYYDGALYVHERNYRSENEIRMSLSETELIQIDRSRDEGLISWFCKKTLGLPTDRPVVCDNNRKAKVLALWEAGYEYINETVKYKGSIIDGINLLVNIPVYYTDVSTNIEFEQENYIRDTERITGTVLEEPVDANNHHMDGIRYVAMYLKSKGVLVGK